MSAIAHLLEGFGIALAVGVAIAALATLFLFLRAGVPAYLTFRGKRVVVCPETCTPAAVEVDARDAAIAAITERPLRLESCSRWPQREDCGQECLRQIQSAPADCLVRNILARWYEGKSCVYCRKHFDLVHWHDHRPALLSPEGRTVAWSEIPPERIGLTFSTHRPACWDCHVAETFRREHPGLVTDRPGHGQESHLHA